MDRDHRQAWTNVKHSYTNHNMAAPQAPPPFFNFASASRAPHDDHYHNAEHQPQRRRMESPHHHHPPAQHHFPGDGFDFRRPVMSGNGWGMNAGAQRTRHDVADTIDLTEDYHSRALSRPHLALPTLPNADAAEAPGPSTRAPQRLPRFEREIIDLADSEEDEPQQQPAPQWRRNQQAPGNPHEADEDSLFIPQDDPITMQPWQPRPTTAGLRRPGFAHQPSPADEDDDIEVTGSRPLSRQRSRRQTPMYNNRNATPNLANNADVPIDLTADDDDDDVVHTDTRPIPGINGDRPAMSGSGIGVRERPAGQDFLMGMGMGIGRLAQRLRGNNVAAAMLARHAHLEGGNNEDPNERARRAHQRLMLIRQNARDAEHALERANGPRSQAGTRRRPAQATAMPMNMDFLTVGFDLGIEPARPPTPKYAPPPPAEKGFTRSPAEDEEVVCPNCGDELAVGKDDVKQQVWVVKACGHAYCGECATRTRPPASKKGKGKATDPSIPPPLKKCVVVGCEKPATKAQMIHVYMSS